MADSGVRGSSDGDLEAASQSGAGARVWRKAIPEERDRLQSDVLVLGVGILLSMYLGLRIMVLVGISMPPTWFFWSCGASFAFAALVWALKGSTLPGALLGGLICLKMLMQMMRPARWTQTALPELIAVFVLTYLATRFRRARKERMGIAEARRGRRAAQVAANLGAAAFYASSPETAVFAAAFAALAEAAADTISSEMGQALGGPTVLITTGERVPAGTDGGISIAGTACGVAAAAIIAGMAVLLNAVDGRAGLAVFVMGCVGLLFDSLLGATVERRGWVGNDWVNLLSTWATAWLTIRVVGMIEPPMPFW